MYLLLSVFFNSELTDKKNKKNVENVHSGQYFVIFQHLYHQRLLQLHATIYFQTRYRKESCGNKQEPTERNHRLRMPGFFSGPFAGLELHHRCSKSAPQPKNNSTYRSEEALRFSQLLRRAVHRGPADYFRGPWCEVPARPLRKVTTPNSAPRSSGVPQGCLRGPHLLNAGSPNNWICCRATAFARFRRRIRSLNRLLCKARRGCVNGKRPGTWKQ